MLVRIIVCALVAGAIAGAISALLQQALVIPVLLEAELYESGTATHFAGGGVGDGSAEHRHGPADHSHDQPEPEGGISRHLVTVLMTVGLNVGFALLLLAGFFARSERPSIRRGIVWGIGGFVAFALAPAVGLAPELPGSAAGALEERQVWWVMTAVLAVAALWLIAFVDPPWAVLVAIVLLALPHVIGAPEPDALAGAAPPELSGEFAARVLAVSFAGWAVLGATAAWIWSRQAPEEV